MRTTVLLLIATILALAPALASGDEVARLNDEGIAALDEGDYPTAIELFTEARRSLPLDPILAGNLATARSRYGQSLLEEGRIGEAIRQFRHAASLAPSEAVHHANLGMALVREGEGSEARKSLEKAVAIDKRFYPALAELGAIAYRDGDLREAISYWERAVRERPDAARVVKALDRAKREYEIEKDHRTIEGPHFTISFDGEKDAGVGDRILTILEDARERIGADLGIYPSERTRVILYAGREFQELTGAHDWVGGLFDGRIRIPVRDFVRAEDEIRDTIFHEYTHVVVRSVTERCPSWANEGLAQHYEGVLTKRFEAVLAAAKRSDGLLTLAELGPSFTRFSEASRARLAYVQSLSFTTFLLDRFGPDRFGRFLKSLGDGKTEEEAAKAAFYRPLDELYGEWRKTL